jgi:hypothetical protein
MELKKNEQVVMRKVVRYFRNLEEMAAYLGIDADELIGRIKNQNIQLSLEKKSTFYNSRQQVFRDADPAINTPLFNYIIS